jgi:hypothetical protein
MNSKANDATDLNIDKFIDTEQEVKVVGESSSFLFFCDTMKGLSPHHRPLKEWIRNKTILYVELLQTGPPPSRSDDKNKFEACRRLETRKFS